MLQGDDVACESRAAESQLGWSFMRMGEPIRGDYEGCAWGVEPSLLCLAGAILYPVSMPPDLEYKTHFYRSRKVFFSVIVAVSVSDLILVLYSAPTKHISALGWPYYILLFTTFFGGIIAAIVDDERLQGAYSILYCCAIFIFVLATQSSIPA